MNTPLSRRHLIRTLGALSTLGAGPLLTPGAAWSQAVWPDRPIRFVVNAPPGGTADIAARLAGEGISPALGKPVVVELKAGGSGMIGIQEVLRAPADGYTFLVSVNGVVTEVPHTVKFPGDPLKDLRPVADIFTGTLLLVGNPSVPARTFAELLNWVRSQPKGVSYGSYSAGTASHLLGVQLARATGLNFNHVGYRGSPPAMQDLLGGQIPLMFNSVANVLPQLRDNRLRPFAVAAPKRSEFLPDVPTFAELGFPEMIATTWIGLWATPGVPTAVTDRMHEELRKWLQRVEVRKRMLDMAATPAQPRSAEELARQNALDFEHTAALLKAIGYKPGE